MFEVGDIVKVLPPFGITFSETYQIDHFETSEDGQRVIFLKGIEGGFTANHLEKA